MSKRFENKTLSTQVYLAIAEAEVLLHPNSPMMVELEKKDDWKYGTLGSGADVVANLCTERAPISVFTYRPWNLFTRAMGYRDGNSIFINLYKLDGFNHADLVGLLLHEMAHVCSYQHGNNWPSQDKNKHSVPYWLSSNVGRYL